MSEIKDENDDSTILIATFFIGNARFGVDAIQVQEIVPFKKTTVIHHAPTFVRGVINLRGKVVTVIDLGEKLLLGSVEQNDENRILIVDWKQENVGLLVDSMTEVIQIERTDINPPPENVNGVQASLITGVFKNVSGHLVGLLDIDKVLKMSDEQPGEPRPQ